MENLIFSFNATLPIFLTMALGMLFRKVGLMDESFVAKMNRFVFTAALPALLFEDLSGTDFYEAWDAGFVLFCFFATLAGILIVWGLSFLVKDRSVQGEFIQAGYRSSAAILGIAFIQNLYGTSGMAPLMIIGTVPLYNVMAVIVLSLVKPGRGVLGSAVLKKTARDILTNPIILGILAGLLWSLLKIPQPQILQKTVKNLAVLATPLGLMAMGASFDISRVSGKMKAALGAAFLKLVGLAAIFLPIAVQLGFREEKLVAILVMLGSASTVSCYIMARNMGHEGVLTSSVVMVTTLFSAVTLTGWLFLLKTLGLI
ncbi:MAG: AEC family transporter [Candidatus Limivivens sp.]|nr:AEC family transporter [Candidatus Limivivens sp.]